MEMSPSVVRVWMPMIFAAVAYLFLHDMQPVFWLLALPLLPVLLFMVALAEVHDEGQQIYVKRLWKSCRILKNDVLGNNNSFIDGIGVLRLGRFVFPWGHIYFVHDWSNRPIAENISPIWEILASFLLAISGFVAAQAPDIRGLRIETLQARIIAFVLAGVLLFLFVVTRRKRQASANFALFAGTYVIGLVRW